MKGYKAFNKDMTCRGFQYEIGKEYEMDGEIIPCKRGFHFCKSLADCYQFYSMSENTIICEVKALGEVITDNEVKYVTNHIKILSKVKNPKIKSNLSDSSSGYCNSGNRNSGDWNSGNRNSGVFNSITPTINMFNKATDWTYNDWYNSRAYDVMADCPCTYSDFISESDMSDEEKTKHPEYKTIGGYIKTFIVTQKDKQKWWDELNNNDKNAVKSLPNFDADVFKSCTGITV